MSHVGVRICLDGSKSHNNVYLLGAFMYPALGCGHCDHPHFTEEQTEL